MSKSRLCNLFGVMKISYCYGLQPKLVNIETVKYKALIRQVFKALGMGSQYHFHVNKLI